MGCPEHGPSSCVVLPIDRFTFTHPDGTQSVYIFATPERLAAGELLEVLEEAVDRWGDYAPDRRTKAYQVLCRAGALLNKLAAQRRTP